MSASVAIATTASIQANQASIAASKAHDMQCRLVVQGFDNKTATVQQQKEFASCVQRLNPEPMAGGEVIFIKVWIAIVFISMAVGGYKGYKDEWSSVSVGVGVFLGFCFGFMAGLILLVGFVSIAFLFT